MKIEQPPLHPEVVVIASLTQDSAHNRRELDACYKMACELGGKVKIPEGSWPIDPLTQS